MATRGAWRARHLRAAPDPPRHQPLDPEHARPVDEPDPTMGDLTGAPVVPVEWVGGQYDQIPVRPGVQDATPLDHTAGIGTLPGVDTRTAQVVAGNLRDDDYGADASRRYARPRYQGGPRVHVEQTSAPLDGASPETLRYQSRGVGDPTDPFARPNRAVRRWNEDVPMDMHWFESQPRPRFQANGQGSRERGPVPGRTQFVSPEGAGFVMRPDNWADPIVRRSPRAWDESAVQDGTPESDGGNFGLGQWGL